MSSSPFPRAFSTLGCVPFSLAEARALAARHRLDALELRGLSGSIDLPAALANAFGSPEAARASASDDLRICALDTGFRVSDHTPADRDALLAHVAWAEALGAPLLRVFDGARALDPVGRALALDALAWWRDLHTARGWRVDLMIETHSSLLRTPDILAFLREAPADTRLLWDSHHTWRIGGENPVDTWTALRPHVAHIHVKDSVATPGEKHAYRHVLCGEGEFPMRDLRAALARDGYAGVVSLEWENHWHRDMPPLADALASADARNWW